MNEISIQCNLLHEELAENDEWEHVEVIVAENQTVPLKKYSLSDVTQALVDISTGSSVRAAAKMYNIPKSTLYHHHKIRNCKLVRKSQTIINLKDEAKLVTWIQRCAKVGDPRTRYQVKKAANSILMKRGIVREKPLTDGWLKSFMQRHPDISLRTPQLVTKSSACVTEQDIRRFFSYFHAYLEEKNYMHLTLDPTRWLNSDETGFDLNPVPKKSPR